MSVKEELTIAVLMQFVTTSTDPTTAHVNLGTWETDGTVQVIIHKYIKGVLVNGGSILTNSSFVHESLKQIWK